MDNLISQQAAIDVIMGQPPEPHYPTWYAEQIKTLPSAQPVGYIHIDDVYRLISGHSNYHGDNILSALTCLAEGKDVPNPIITLAGMGEAIK